MLSFLPRPVALVPLIPLLFFPTGCKKHLPNEASLSQCTVIAYVDAPKSASVEIAGVKGKYNESLGKHVVVVPLDALPEPADVVDAVVHDGASESHAKLTVTLDSFPRGRVKDGFCGVVTQEARLGNEPAEKLEDPSGNELPFDAYRSLALDAPSASEVLVQGKAPSQPRPGLFTFEIDEAALAVSALGDKLFAVEPNGVTFSIAVAMKVRGAQRTLGLKISPDASHLASRRRAAAERLRAVAKGQPLPGSAPAGKVATALVRNGEHVLPVPGGKLSVVEDDVDWSGPSLPIEQATWVAVEVAQERPAGSCEYSVGITSVPVVVLDATVTIYDAHTGSALDHHAFRAERGECPDSAYFTKSERKVMRFPAARKPIVDWVRKRVQTASE